MKTRLALFVIAASLVAPLMSDPVSADWQKGRPKIPSDVKIEMKRLRSSDPVERAQGATNLGRMGDRAAGATEDLLELLADETPLVAVFDPKTSRSRPFIGASPPRVMSQDQAIAYVFQVAASGVPAGFESIGTVASIASDALVRIGPAAVPALLDALNDDRPAVRGGSAAALGAGGDARAGEAIVPLLQDTDPGVRFSAAKALDALAHPGAVTALIAVLRDGSPEAREDAAKLLGAHRDSLAAEALYARIKEDPDPKVRASAVTALGGTEDPRRIETLLAALRDKEWSICSAASEQLGTIKDPRSIVPLIQVLRETNPLARERASAALRAITGKDFGISADLWMEWWEKSHPQAATDGG